MMSGKNLATSAVEKKIMKSDLGIMEHLCPAIPIEMKLSEDTGELRTNDADRVDGAVAHMRSLGITDAGLWRDLIGTLSGATSKPDGTVDIDELNAAISFVRSLHPRDGMEAMLGCQMALVHMATLRFARNVRLAPNLLQRDSAERSYTRLSRTFSKQIEALRRYRTGGEQKVTVQHVHVNDGGQAIVGHISHPPQEGGRARSEPATLDISVVTPKRTRSGDRR